MGRVGTVLTRDPRSAVTACVAVQQRVLRVQTIQKILLHRFGSHSISQKVVQEVAAETDVYRQVLWVGVFARRAFQHDQTECSSLQEPCARVVLPPPIMLKLPAALRWTSCAGLPRSASSPSGSTSAIARNQSLGVRAPWRPSASCLIPRMDRVRDPDGSRSRTSRWGRSQASQSLGSAAVGQLRRSCSRPSCSGARRPLRGQHRRLRPRPKSAAPSVSERQPRIHLGEPVHWCRVTV
jgi:hypothetical protein